jgi:hypothetical protein
MLERKDKAAMRHAAMLVGALVAAGCVSSATEPCPCDASERAAPALRGAGPALSIHFADHLGFPYRLSRLAVALDGELLHQQTFEPDRADRPDRIARLALPPGDHTLQVLAVASYAATRIDADEGCNVLLRASKSFAMRDQPALLRIDLYTGSVTKPFAERVALHIATQGTDGSAVELEPDDEPGGTLDAQGFDPAPQCLDDGPLLPVDNRPRLDFEESWRYPF